MVLLQVATLLPSVQIFLVMPLLCTFLWPNPTRYGFILLLVFSMLDVRVVMMLRKLVPVWERSLDVCFSAVYVLFCRIMM